jgi:hypothetical protein
MYVGGLLVLPEYAFPTKSGYAARHFIGGVKSATAIIASTITTDLSFPDESHFYYKSRGIELFSTLYVYQTATFLLTPTKWKLFYLDNEKKHIHAFPCDPVGTDGPASEYERVTSTLSMRHLCLADQEESERRYQEFLTAITLCILSRPFEDIPTLTTPLNSKVTIPSKRKRKTREAVTVGQFMVSDNPPRYQDVWIVEPDD